MSQLIRPRPYTWREAALYQQRPSTIIDAVEHAEAQSYPAVHVLYEHQPTFVVSVGGLTTVFKCGLTAATRYAPVDKSWATTAPEVIDATLADVQGTNWSRWTEQTKAAFRRAAAGQGRTVTSASRLRVERLAAIQAALGFTTQDFAAVLGLSRPQLYRWLDAGDDVRLQDAKRQRLATVERISKAWQEFSTAPLRSVSHEPLADGSTVFSRLTADAIDEAALLGTFAGLADKLLAKPKTRSQLLAEAGFKRRPSIRSLPSDE